MFKSLKNHYIVILSICLISPIKVVPIKNYKITKIIIDAGHGGKDPGCRSHCKKYIEKKIAMEVCAKLYSKIKKAYPNINIICTRPLDKDNKGIISLNTRAKKANDSKADLFLSIHCNFNKDKRIKGFETYIMGPKAKWPSLGITADLKYHSQVVVERENRVILMEDNYEKNYKEYFNKNSIYSKILAKNYALSNYKNSLLLAQKIDSEIKKTKSITNRGIKEGGFLLLWKVALCSILIEIGYISNTKEAEYLNSKKGQDEIASAIFLGFKEYKKELEKNI